MVLVSTSDERPIDVQAGNLQIRLAESMDEVRASQRLRYQVFCEEMTAKPTAEMVASGLEFDSFDDYCDHLLVFDHGNGPASDSVVGSYRLMRREAAERHGQFYSIDEYDISKLLAFQGEILECGRSCVANGYRNGTTMQLLWRGIAAYISHFEVDILFGCASLPGIDVDELSMPLSYLYHHHLAPPALRPKALPDRYVPMNRMSAEEISRRRAWAALPPLIKGYLRLGGFVGDGAVVDPEFGTTDVSIIVKTELVTDKYIRHYSRDDAAKTEDES